MPLFWLSLAFLVGILIGKVFSVSLEAWLLMGVIAVALLFLQKIPQYFVIHHSGLVRNLIYRINLRLLRSFLGLINFIRRYRFGIPFPWLLIALIIGAFRYQSIIPEPEPTFLGYYNDLDGEVLLEGKIIDLPDVRDGYLNLTVEAVRLRLPESLSFVEVNGRVLARHDPGKTWNYGDHIRLEGYLYTPNETEIFSYKDYLAQRGVYSQMRVTHSVHLNTNSGNFILSGLFALRARSLSILYKIYPDPEAALLAGILLGIEQYIPSKVNEAFQVTGTSHIIAISGFNMTLLAGIFSTFFTRLLGRWRGASAAIIGISLYTILVGAQAPVVRAAVMGGFSVLASQVGRRQHGLNSLGFTSACMTLFNPNILWDVGFQLSFAATLGLVLYGESWTLNFELWVKKWLPDGVVSRIKGPVSEYFLLTIAAQMMTLPIIFYHFQRLSLISLVANPLILPVQPAVMIVGGISLLAGLVWLPAGSLLSLAGWPFLAFTIRIVEALAAFPGAELLLPPLALGWVLLIYGLILVFTFFSAKTNQVWKEVRPGMVFAILAFLVIQVWRTAWSMPDGLLHMVLLNINTNTNSGDGLLIQSPTGRNILIDGGPSMIRLSDSLGRRLIGFGNHLDALIIAGVEENQVQALPEILPRYPPELVLWAGEMHGNRVSRQVHASLQDQKINIQRAKAGMILELGDGAEIQILSVSRLGAILLLEWREFRALIPLGIDFNALDTLQTRSDLEQISVYMLAGNGFAPLNPPEWIASLDPEVILLSVASRDVEGLPDIDVLDRLEDYNILRTDQNGWIDLSTDGEKMWVEAELGEYKSDN